MHKHGPQPAAANMRQMVSLILFVKILVLTCTIAQLHMPKHGPQPAAANMRQMVREAPIPVTANTFFSPNLPGPEIT